jgi:hypothetical protein
VLFAAALIYGTGQVRELLWVALGEHFSSKFTEYPGFWTLSGYIYEATFETGLFSIFVTAISLIFWTPAYYAAHYLFSGSANTAHPTAAGVVGSIAAGWLAAGAFITIALYNIISVSFPKLQLFHIVWICISGLLVFLCLPLVLTLVWYLLDLVIRSVIAKTGLEHSASENPSLDAPPAIPPDKPAKKSKILRAAASLGKLVLRKPSVLSAVIYMLLLARGAVLLLVLFICSYFAVLVFPIAVAAAAFGWNIGAAIGNSLVLTNLFLSAILGATSLFILIGRSRKWPLMGLAAAAVAILSFFDWNDNHQIREISQVAGAPQPKASTGRPSLEDAFANWYASRPDRDKFADGYPVYLIAAQGGGLYAAYHTAQFLARTQDHYASGPSFADHIFAISAVSGASLGASVFVSLLNEKPGVTQPSSSRDNLSLRARRVLSQDLLSPLLGASLFTDLPARWLPCVGGFCPGRVLDRAPALERALETAWQSGGRASQSENPLAKSFYADWDIAKNGPALLLNTTEVETGERVVISPFKLQHPESPQLNALTDRADIDVALSTAAVLSARFPGMTPAGWYMTKDEGQAQKRRLVDGGYFDNSGVATALDVMNRLEKLKLSPHPKFIVIALTSAAEDGTANAPSYGFGETLSPLRTLESIRSSRARFAIRQAQLFLNGGPCPSIGPSGNWPCAYEMRMRTMVLASGDVRLPLGWQLSEKSRAAIERYIGDPVLCNMIVTGAADSGTTFREQVALNVRRHNSCLLAAIGTDLHASY